jgi:hypothetical protein
MVGKGAVYLHFYSPKDVIPHAQSAAKSYTAKSQSIYLYIAYIGICKKLVKNLATGWSLVDMENSGIFKTMKRQWNIPFIEL